MKITHVGDRDLKLTAELPSVQRQLDLIWKALQELKTHPFSEEIEMAIQQIAKVKAKYQLPEDPHEARR